MADNSVTGLSGKLVTQPSLPSNATSDFDTVTACKVEPKYTSRDSMKLVDQAPLPKGGNSAAPTKGRSKS